MKLIANQITNLTDARYFAARGCYALFFDLDNPDLEDTQISAIVEWISGPHIYVHTTQPEQISPAIASLAEGIWTDATGWSLPIHRFRTWDPDLVKTLDEATWIVRQRDWLAFQTAFPQGQEVILWVDTPDLQCLDVAADYGVWAVMIDGGDEETTGVKSFEAYDDFIDRWEELSAEE